MRLKVHVATALAATVVIFDVYGWPPPPAAAYALLAAVIGNLALDELGHTTRCYRGRCYPARNRLHSLPAVATLGLLLSMPLLGAGVAPPAALTPLVSLLIHWVEDLVTERGVYLAGRRVVLLGVRYDSPAANTAAVLASALALFLAPPQCSDWLAAAGWAAALAALALAASS